MFGSPQFKDSTNKQTKKCLQKCDDKCLHFNVGKIKTIKKKRNQVTFFWCYFRQLPISIKFFLNCIFTFIFFKLFLVHLHL